MGSHRIALPPSTSPHHLPPSTHTGRFTLSLAPNPDPNLRLSVQIPIRGGALRSHPSLLLQPHAPASNARMPKPRSPPREQLHSRAPLPPCPAGDRDASDRSWHPAGPRAPSTFPRTQTPSSTRQQEQEQEPAAAAAQSHGQQLFMCSRPRPTLLPRQPAGVGATGHRHRTRTAPAPAFHPFFSDQDDEFGDESNQGALAEEAQELATPDGEGTPDLDGGRQGQRE